MHVLLCKHVSCTQHILFTFQIPTRARNINPFSWSDEGRPVLKHQGPQIQDPRSIHLPLQLVQVKFHMRKWKCSRESMSSHASPDLWISAEKNQDQQNSEAHFVMLSSAEKNTAEILGTTIESAEVHYTKPEGEFRWGIGLNPKFRRKKKSAEVRYTICVVELRWKAIYTKVLFFWQPIRGHRISIFRRFFFSRKLRSCAP